MMRTPALPVDVNPKWVKWACRRLKPLGDPSAGDPGHGFNGPNYRFLPTDVEVAPDGVSRGATIVPWYALQEAVEAANGRRILFIDTCHAGNAYNQRLGNATYHANIIAYTAARFDQTAKEDDNRRHGLFTYAVVEGLDGKATVKGKPEITTKSLADYVTERVEELAKAQHSSQEPQYFKGRDAEDYVLARWWVTSGRHTASTAALPR